MGDSHICPVPAETERPHPAAALLKLSQPDKSHPAPPIPVFQASATIETALLMPLILLVIFTAIGLDLYTISRTTCESAACEQAVSGKVYEDLFLPGSEAASRSGHDTSDERSVSFESGTKTVYGHYSWPIREEAVYRKYHPVKGIRVSRSAAGLIKDFTGD
jgi:hypothetical protein